ncbi:pentapeptide repeat-containing protein [Eggerthella sinensis]|jgi:uncharacterized protein YjbI with pentapeptide repeats|uniref:pentapeptide repeat-containing protein n=1 Tax=Eggerthella sinensis TaxID=242230 RepID=UPI00248EFFF7|nr:hypothetical protein [Eggerthella sinensis]
MRSLTSCEIAQGGRQDGKAVVHCTYDDGSNEELECEHFAVLEIPAQGIQVSNAVIDELRLSGIIEGEVLIQNCFIAAVAKGHCVEFEERVDFSGSAFLGSCDFSATFHGRVRFDKATFFDTCEFSGTFNRWTSFEGASFWGDVASFQEADLGGISFKMANARGCDFNFQEAYVSQGDFLFSDVRIEQGLVDFSGTVFDDVKLVSFLGLETDSTVKFNRASLDCNELRWYHANVEKLVFLSCDLNCAKAEFQMECHSLIINGGTNQKSLDFRPTTGLSAFSLCGLANMGIILIDRSPDELIKLIDVPVATVWEKGRQWRNPTHKDKADQYFTLKQVFNRNGFYENEDAMYCAYRRELRKQRLETAKNHLTDRNAGIIARLKEAMYFPRHFLYDFLVCDVVGCYATSPKRVFATCLITILVFSFLMTPITVSLDTLIHAEDFAQAIAPVLHTWSDGLYNSAQAFLTVGFLGSESAGAALRTICAIEGFLGVFLITYFTASFAHRVLR